MWCFVVLCGAVCAVMVSPPLQLILHNGAAVAVRNVPLQTAGHTPVDDLFASSTGIGG